jgi:hypothetical protein
VSAEGVSAEGVALFNRARFRYRSRARLSRERATLIMVELGHGFLSAQPASHQRPSKIEHEHARRGRVGYPLNAKHQTLNAER